MDGVLNLLKPPGMTSSDAVVFLRGRLREKRVGHAGTLDPDACGVLPICFGTATRLADYLMAENKTYLAEFTLGISTDTYDASGHPLRRRALPDDADVRLRAAIPSFIGRIMQRPPAFSSVHIRGQKAYRRAQKGCTVVIPERVVHIDAIDMLRGGARPLLRIRCGKGTYIRSLAYDLGERIGCGAHLSYLLREKTGMFSVENAYTIAEVLALHACGQLDDALVTPGDAVAALPELCVGKQFAGRLACGMKIARAWTASTLAPGTICRVTCENVFYGIAQVYAEEEAYACFRAMLYKSEGSEKNAACAQ